MTTYSTYQKAKIANPESDIYVSFASSIKEFITREYRSSLGPLKSDLYKPCNPADYCVTVEKFLADEREFVDGDLFLNHEREMVEIGKEYDGGVVITTHEISRPLSSIDSKSFILRAAAISGEEESRTNQKLHYTIDKPFLQTGEDYEHTKTLNFIRDRLVEVHGEPKNLDYMHKLNNAIMFVERMEEAKISNNGFEPVAFKSSKGEKIKGSIEINHPEGATGYRVQGQYTEWFKGSEAEGWSIFCSDAPSVDCIDATLPVIAIEKPKRTKIEFEKFDGVKLSELFALWECGELFTFSNPEYKKVFNIDRVLRLHRDGGAFKGVETEITGREEFIDEVCAINEKTHGERRQYLVESLFDSGRVKLIN